MSESALNSEKYVNYNSLSCHACLSTNRNLTAVGDYLNIYIKICDNSLKKLSSQTNVCWECLALLKKVKAFRKKVENARKIQEYCVKQQIVLKDNLSNLTLSSIETTTFDFPAIDEDSLCTVTRRAREHNYLQKVIVIDDSDKSELRQQDSYLEKSDLRQEDNELMIQIEDVRGQCDILHEPILDSSASPEVRTKIERLNSPAGEAERRHRRWQRATMLVYKRICSHRYAQHFLRPVTDDIAPLYSTIVRRPMDLSTIKRRIKDGVIRTTAELTRALQLMFSNALMYNSSHHFIYQMTLEFREETLRELSVLASAEEGAGADSPLSRLLSRHAPPPVLAQRTSATHRHQELIKIAPASRIRRASIYHVEDSTEPRNTPISSTHRAPADPGVPEDSRRSTSVLGKRRASVYQSADPKPTRSRRTSMYHPADPEVPEDSRRSTSVLGKRRASVYQPADPKPTRARRASMYHPSDSEVPEDSRRSTSVLGKRRASVYQPADPKPAPRARRASMYHPADPETKEPKKRTKWDWPSIEDEHLIPKKYKNCVVVL